MDGWRNLRSRKDALRTASGIYTNDRNLNEESSLEILAYLEYWIRKEYPLEAFLTNVFRHLESENFVVKSEKDIELKLGYFWDHWRDSSRHKPSQWRKIFKLGIRGLPNMGAERCDSVLARTMILEDLGSPRVLRNNHTYSPRKPKGRPRKNHSTRKSVRRRLRLDLECGNSAGSRSVNSKHPSRTPSHLLTPTSSSFEEQIDQKVESAPWSLNFTQESPNINAERLILRQEMADLKENNWQLTLHLEGVKDLGLQKDDEILYWRNLYRTGQELNERLNKENQRMQLALIKSGNNSGSKTETELLRDNDLLRQQLRSRKFTFTFEAPFKDSFREGNICRVSANVKVLLLKYRKLMPGYELPLSMEKLQNVEHPDLATFIERTFRDAFLNLRQTVAFELKLRDFLLTLVSAALSLWVFEADVESLFQGTGYVYKEIRSFLNNQDPKVAASLEFAAHQRCTEGQYIQELAIPQRAKYLVRRLNKSIIPILENHSSIDEKYADMLDEWREETTQFELTEIFKQALYMKLRLLLSTDVYKCIFHAPGTAFNSNSMEELGEATLETQKPSKLVLFTIFPTILCYNTSEDAFSYNRFLSVDHVPECATPKPLVKSIVLLR